jgi:hypothetical protein
MPTPTLARPAPWTRVALALLALALAPLGGCGAFDSGGGDDGPAPLSITTPTLPPAGLNYTYSANLQAAGGAGGYVWTQVAGSTPPGVTISSSGTVSGTPTAVGTYSVSVQVTDAEASSDTASYAITVMPFQMSVVGLHWGDGWTGESYAVTSVSGAGVTFSLDLNGSGASLVGANPSAGTVTYVAGPGAGLDRIRGTSGSGESATVDVVVVENPVANMIARFSTTDVWHVRFEGKQGSHPYASDFDASLASIGLRAGNSYDASGTTADQVARAYVRQQTLRHLNAMYLNFEDGSPAAGGLDISFPFEEPPWPPYASPADGDVDAPAPNHFNVISVLAGGLSGVIGTAYLDTTTNAYQENDTTSPSTGGPFGVFCDEISDFFNQAYLNSTLPGSPVSSADLPALKALLYGTASPGGRYAELQRIGEGYGRTLAAVAAHEIGHSLGLDHTSPAQSGSIMNAVGQIGPGASYAFVAADVAQLQSGLPGPGRGGSPLHAASASEVLQSLLYTGAPGDTAVVCGPCCMHGRRANWEPQTSR